MDKQGHLAPDHRSEGEGFESVRARKVMSQDIQDIQTCDLWVRAWVGPTPKTDPVPVATASSDLQRYHSPG
jgi:hypothetical protein